MMTKDVAVTVGDSQYTIHFLDQEGEEFHSETRPLPGYDYLVLLAKGFQEETVELATHFVVIPQALYKSVLKRLRGQLN